MTDVVLKLPIQPGEEAIHFGRYLSRFMESFPTETQEQADEGDAPRLMIRADPVAGEEAKILIFQENGLADAFSAGWARVRSALS
jgi:hypothetical protein